MKFWVNDGHCQPSSDFPTPGYDEDLPVPANDPGFENCSAGIITCPRDLENFARLWICGLPALGTNYQVILGWGNIVSGSPAINPYNAVETNGGTGYLTDTNTAAEQCLATPHGTSHYSVYFTGPPALV